MGWSFNWSPSFGKEDLINRFLSKGFFVEGCSVIDSRVTGSAFWAVLEHDGKRAIWLALMAPGGKDEGYGYKGIDETSGPSRVDCPMVLIRQCTEPTNEYSRAWREEVKNHHAQQASLQKMQREIKAGLRLECAGMTFTTMQPAGPGSRQGWVVKQEGTGKLFRMPASQVRRCLIALASAPPVEVKVVRPQPQQTAMAFL